MPQIKSAIKRVQVAERNRQRNKSAKSAIRTSMKRFFTILEAQANGAEEATPEAVQAAMSQAFSLIDRAASKGILHRNTAARRKSRLARTLHRVEGTAESAVAS